MSAGESIVFAITGKILYIEAPVGGTVRFNSAAEENPLLIGDDPYKRGWLFKIKPAGRVEDEWQSFASVGDYVASLRSSVGLKNPKGLKGGVSGICKAVYMGIREQKIQ